MRMDHNCTGWLEEEAIKWTSRLAKETRSLRESQKRLQQLASLKERGEKVSARAPSPNDDWSVPMCRLGYQRGWRNSARAGWPVGAQTLVWCSRTGRDFGVIPVSRCRVMAAQTQSETEGERRKIHPQRQLLRLHWPLRRGVNDGGGDHDGNIGSER